MEQLQTGVIVIREGSDYPCVQIEGEKLAPVLIEQRLYAIARAGKQVQYYLTPHPCKDIVSDYGFAVIIIPKESEHP